MKHYSQVKEMVDISLKISLGTKEKKVLCFCEITRYKLFSFTTLTIKIELKVPK